MPALFRSLQDGTSCRLLFIVECDSTLYIIITGMSLANLAPNWPTTKRKVVLTLLERTAESPIVA